MISILVIDDKPARYAELIDIICPKTTPNSSFSFRSSVADALELIEDNLYDLVIIDMMLPSSTWSEPESGGGASVLESFEINPGLKIPRYVVGITAAEIDDPKVGAAFEKTTWTLLRARPGDHSWMIRLAHLITHINSLLNASSPQSIKIVNQLNYLTDVCIVTALRVPELQAIRNLPLTWSADIPLDSNTFVSEATLESGKLQLSLVAASCSKMGTVEAALLCAKLISTYRPRLLVMTGICAGLEGKTNIGDVIVANPVWDWQSVKLSKEPDGEMVVLPALDFMGVERELLNRIALLSEDNNFLNDVKHRWNGDSPSTSLRILLGPMASGSVLVADGETLIKVKNTQNKDMLGLEMEAYAIYAAARIASTPKPLAIAMKSVCDYGNYLKDDKFQKYAAYTSAQCLFEFLRRYGSDLKDLMK